MRKRAIVLVCVLLAALMVSACGAAASGPSAVATKFMESAKSGDIDGIVGCFEPETATLLRSAFELAGDDAMSSSDLLGLSDANIDSLTYKITDEQIDGDSATVTIEVTATVDGEAETESADLPLTQVDGQWYISNDFGL